MSRSFCVVYVTAPKGNQAARIAERLVKKRLVACVNIVPAVDSLYWWKGKVVKEGEALLILKTRRALLRPLTRFVTSIHPYSVPEVIALPIVGGSKSYLDWVRAEAKG